MSKLDIEICFNEKGNLKFDPYRCDRDDHRYQLLFDEEGYCHAHDEVKRLIEKKKWAWDSDAVALYHASMFASNTKGNYTSIYYWR